MDGSGHIDTAFDGIICIGGEDWWYHNRGHFDFQVMRRLAQRWPVLFVNSLGVRMPSLKDNRLFFTRVGRKLRSFCRGLAHVENGFWVFSPISAPGGTGKRLTDWALAPQIRVAAARAGIKRPLLWVHCPAGAPLVGQLGEVGVVMQRTDRFEAFPEADGTLVADQITMLKQVADLVVYAAPHLMAEEQGKVGDQILITHGVDTPWFIEAGNRNGPGPIDVALLPRPRVGFIGGIDAHTFDPPLFLDIAKRMPELHFVLVGGCSLPEGWCPYRNVSLLGRKPYDQVAEYMAACDVLIMPWNDSDWIKACNPIKLKEYLAVGRPVVTKDFPALDGWRQHVRIANDAEGFVTEIRAALAERLTPEDVAAARRALIGESWDDKAELLGMRLASIGFATTGIMAAAQVN